MGEGGRGGAALAAGQTANCLIGSRPPPHGPSGQRRSTAGNKKSCNLVSWSRCQRSHRDEKEGADNTRGTTGWGQGGGGCSEMGGWGSASTDIIPEMPLLQGELSNPLMFNEQGSKHDLRGAFRVTETANVGKHTLSLISCQTRRICAPCLLPPPFNN